MLFAKAGMRMPTSRTVQLFEEPIHEDENALIFGVTLDKWLTWFISIR
jgi:hypothetical protein